MENTVISAQEALNMTLQYKNNELPRLLEDINKKIRCAASSGSFSCKISVKNIFEDDIHKILSSPRAEEIRRGFEKKCAVEELCQKCGYARRFG